MLVAWRERGVLGIEIIDTGHHLIIDAINRLHQGCEAGDGEAAVAEILPGLLDYLPRQFETEGRLMTKVSFNRQASHEAEHRRLLNGLYMIWDSHERGTESAGMLMLNLVCFLVAHVRGSDPDTFRKIEPAERAA